MSSTRAFRLSLAVLGSSLLLNFLLVSCAAKAVLPPDQDPGGDGAATNAELLTRLDSVMARLTRIEAKVDQQAVESKQQAVATEKQTATITAQIDSLEVTIGTQAADPTLSVRQVARMDSVLALTSFIANDMASASWQVCGNVDAGLGMALSPNAEVYGEAAGDAGAWAGTGAFAGAEVHAGLQTSFQIGMDGGLSFGGCAPLFNDAPPSRASASSNSAVRELRNTLDDAVAHLGLTRNSVRNSLGNIANGVQSAAMLNIENAVEYLPLPSQLASIASDPVGHITQAIPAKIDDAVQMLCLRNWGSMMSATIPVACDRIHNNPFEIGGFFAIFDQLPEMQLALNTVTTGLDQVKGTVNTLESGLGSIQGAVSGVQSHIEEVEDNLNFVVGKLSQVQAGMTTVAGTFQTICSKMNQVGGTTLTISNPLGIGPDNLFDDNIFPFYSPIGC